MKNMTDEAKEKKKMIIEVSLNRFLENGLEKTSMRDLCKAADITASTLYYYFESKDDVIMECFRHQIAIADSITQAMIDLHLPSVKDMLTAMLNEISKHKHGVKFMAQVLASPNHCSDCQIEMKALHKRYDKYAKQICDYYNISFDMFRPIFFISLTVIYDYLIKGDEEFFKVQTDIVINGIEKMIIKA